MYLNNNKALFLDRDGVINVDKGYTHNICDAELLPGIISLASMAQHMNFLLIVITNQSGIARKMYTQREMNRFHQHIFYLFNSSGIHIEDFYYCMHHPHFNGRCLCRKPGTLLFEKAISKYHLNPLQSFMIGDNERDILAGARIGCKTILLGDTIHSSADWIVKDLWEAQTCLKEQSL